MKKQHLKTAALFVGFLFVGYAGTATAQEKKNEQSGRQQTAQQQKPDGQNADTGPQINEAGKKARVMLDQIDIVGSLAKPQALFILPGSDPRVDGIAIDRSFLDDIFRPVEKDFFPQKGKRKLRGAIPW